MTKIKNNPTGMRYDKTKMDFVMQTENIKSPQKVLNFLLDKYWWEKKIGVNPILERKAEFVTAGKNVPKELVEIAKGKKPEPKEKKEDLSNLSSFERMRRKKLGL